MFCIDPDEFERIYEPLDVKSKKIHIVDSGLTFNLPYPLILRPQRGVDLIISFDFSARPSDSSPPFKVSKIGYSLICINKFKLNFIFLVELVAHLTLAILSVYSIKAICFHTKAEYSTLPQFLFT